MLDALRDNAGVLIILLFLAVGILFAAVAVLFRQWSLLRRNVTILKRGADGENLVEKVADNTVRIGEIFQQLEEQNAQREYLADVLAGAVQRVAVVRYDAFEDMGGKMSFSVALLDDNGDGVVLTSIYGRNENRVYAKALRRGSSSHVLSREEAEAVRRAMGYKPPIIRAGGKSTPGIFDVQSAGEGEGVVREEDGSWVM